MKKVNKSTIEKNVKEVLKSSGADMVFVTEDGQVFLKRGDARNHARGKSEILTYPESESANEDFTKEDYEVQIEGLGKLVDAESAKVKELEKEKESLTEEKTRLFNLNDELVTKVNELTAEIARLKLPKSGKSPSKKTTVKTKVAAPTGLEGTADEQ